MENKQFEPGEIIVLVSGEYSDSGVDFVAKSMRSFSLTEAIANWVSETGGEIFPDEDYPNFVKENEGISFYLWLVREKWIEKVLCHKISHYRQHFAGGVYIGIESEHGQDF